MAASRLLHQLGVIAFLHSSLSAAQPTPLTRDAALGVGIGDSGEKPGRVEEESNKGRQLYASGAGRTRRGWTLGTQEESSGMRVLFKVRLVSGMCAVDVSHALLRGVTARHFLYFVTFPLDFVLQLNRPSSGTCPIRQVQQECGVFSQQVKRLRVRTLESSRTLDTTQTRSCTATELLLRRRRW